MFVQVDVIQFAGDLPDHLFQITEIHEHPGHTQLGARDGHFDLEVMAVHGLTLPPASNDPVGSGKSVFNC